MCTNVNDLNVQTVNKIQNVRSTTASWQPNLACSHEDILKLGADVGLIEIQAEEISYSLNYNGQEDDDDWQVPLLDQVSYVRQMPRDPCMVDCHKIDHPGPESKETEALVAEPGIVEAKVPQDFVPGMVITAYGPFGEHQVKPHPDEVPGSTLCYTLKPLPEFVVTVPPGMKNGHAIKIDREDGRPISVKIPGGCRPGESFEVTPPAMMVRVPKGVNPGDYVVFRTEETVWWRVQVPEKETLKLERFFAARLPEDQVNVQAGQ